MTDPHFKSMEELQKHAKTLTVKKLKTLLQEKGVAATSLNYRRKDEFVNHFVNVMKAKLPKISEPSNPPAKFPMKRTLE